MKIYNPNEPLISIHIPKCAGESFKRVLKRWYGNRLLYHYHNERRNKPPKKHKLTAGLFRKRLRHNICIHGHFNHKRGNGTSDYYPEIDQFITILRDPFEIHLSNYFYVKRLQKKAFRDGRQDHLADPSYDLRKYLAEAKKSYLLKSFPPVISVDNYRQIIDKRFVYVGITEDLQTSVDMLANKLGVSSVLAPVKNISPRREKIPESAREEFIHNNPLEYAIYEYVLSRYKE